METDDAHVAEDDEATSSKFFTPLQSRPFWAPILDASVALCPSMDLMTLRVADAQKEGPLWLHRTLDFTQLSVLGGRAAAWRPDGRWLAVGNAAGEVTLYHVEALMTHGATLTAHVDATLLREDGGFAISPAGDVIRIAARPGIQSLCWRHCVAPVPGASLYERLRTKMATNLTDILPPSSFHYESNPDLLPSATQPLSVLIAISETATMDAFLLGGFPIVSRVRLGFGAYSPQVRVQTSLDLVHWLVCERQGRALVQLHSMPMLFRHRYTLQAAAVMLSTCRAHVVKLETRIQEVHAAYTNSLKPLDLKWEALVKLLANYGLEGVPVLLAQYILLGHAACTQDLSNAMDQFFTGIHMNDQLIQRMDRSLTVAIANVESMLRQILAGCQAMFVQADALLGLAKASSTPGLLPMTDVIVFHQSAQKLVLTVEAALTALVDSRFRIRDWISWMRSTGSAIKARGTDPASAQRENAKKRRINDATLQRVLEYLRQQSTLPSGESNTEGLAANIMGLTAGRYFTDDATVDGTIHNALTENRRAFMNVYHQPQTYMENHPSRSRWPIALPSYREPLASDDDKDQEPADCLVAVTCRQGQMWNGVSTDGLGAFYPETTENQTFEEHQWALIAEASPRSSRVNLYALPLTCEMETLGETGEPAWEEFDDFPEDQKHFMSPDYCTSVNDYYLATSFQLPDDCQVQEVVYFGDDGKSALFAEGDKPVLEKDQSLGLVVKRPSDDRLELWVIPNYDGGLTWESRPFPNAQTARECDPSIAPDQVLRVHTLQASPGVPTDLELCSQPGAVATAQCYAKVRSLGHALTDPRLFVSGSRGIAAVVTDSPARVGIWDLNENEEEEEEEEEEAEDEEEP